MTHLIEPCRQKPPTHPSFPHPDHTEGGISVLCYSVTVTRVTCGVAVRLPNCNTCDDGPKTSTCTCVTAVSSCSLLPPSTPLPLLFPSSSYSPSSSSSSSSHSRRCRTLLQLSRMRSLAALTLSALFSLAGAIQLDVNSTGGITSSPLQYGLIFEVGENLAVLCLIDC